VFTYVLATAGSSAAAPLPPQNAICLSWHTGRAGRSYRGRTYLPGIGEDKVDGGGIIVASFVTSLVGAAYDFLAAQNTDNIPLVVFSRTLASKELVNAVSVDNIIDTQRRRLR